MNFNRNMLQHRYKATRLRDNKIFEVRNYKNVRYKIDVNLISDYPPELGCSAVFYNSIVDSWQTTIIVNIEKINDNKYILKTKNSVYILEKV